jgi:hypothetical protein
MMAAKCFLSVENLNVASKGLRRAQAIESVLRADDDLMAETNGEQPEPERHEADLRIERRATVRSKPARGSVAGAPSSPVGTPRVTITGEPALDAPLAASGPGRWLRRLRPSRPARHVA